MGNVQAQSGVAPGETGVKNTDTWTASVFPEVSALWNRTPSRNCRSSSRSPCRCPGKAPAPDDVRELLEDTGALLEETPWLLLETITLEEEPPLLLLEEEDEEEDEEDDDDVPHTSHSLRRLA